MKKFIIFNLMLIIIITISIPSSVFALTDGDWEFQLLNETAHITKYIGSQENVTVPQTLRGAQVKSMNDDIFRNNNSIKTIIIPGTIESVPEQMFWCANGIETVEISEGVKTIKWGAFYNCKNLRKVVLPSTIKNIESDAFSASGNLSEISIPQGIEIIGEGALSGSGIESIDLSDMNVDLSWSIFKGCTKLTKALLPNNITVIPPQTFWGCSSLSEINIPETVKEIGVNAFSGTSISQINLPRNLKIIDQYAFFGTKSKEVIVPYGVEKIGYMAFGDCKELNSLYIPSTVTQIQNAVLYKSPNAIIYCPVNSVAHNYCTNSNTSYLIDDSADTKINVIYNGNRISFHKYGKNPELIDNRTLVPLRAIFETLGAEVLWNENTQTITAITEKAQISLQIGSTQMYVNQNIIPLDVPAMLINNRTLVPVRAISEAFGCEVSWNQSTQTVIISK